MRIGNIDVALASALCPIIGQRALASGNDYAVNY